MASPLIAGAATADITPKNPQFLYGYPHVERYSTGVHDPLFSSALFLCDGATSLLFVANDVLQIGRDTARRVRDRIERETGIPATNMMITATHTHSGPKTVDMLADASDPIIPKTDPLYVAILENGIVDAALNAYRTAWPAKIGLAVAQCPDVGTNRHDPSGPSDPEVPVLIVRNIDEQMFLAAMIVCSMHPTVLHEDSTLVSGDFPAMARQYLQEHVLGRECPVLCHTGPSGNQSPRHVTKANTFDEAERLGGILGKSVGKVIGSMEYTGDATLGCDGKLIDLPPRIQLSVGQAQEHLDRATKRLAMLRKSAAERGEVRTAECDWFGAEESLTFARAATSGQLDDTIASVMPAEITVMRIGPWIFVGWPGEVFVEFSLQVKSQCPNCHIISLANGELQGYLASEEAFRRGWYEGMNSVFSSPESGRILTKETLNLLAAHRAR